MSFTRRHYEETARIIAHSREYAGAYPSGSYQQNEYKRGYHQALTRVSSELRSMFAADNPRFDAERFAKACEPGSGK